MNNEANNVASVALTLTAIAAMVAKTLRVRGLYTNELRDEMIQRCALHACENIASGRYDGSGSFEGWVVFNAKRFLSNQLRNDRTFDRTNVLAKIDESSDAPSVDVTEAAPRKAAQGAIDNAARDSAVRACDRAIESERITVALASLSAERQEAIVMLADGTRPLDVATALGRSPSWVTKAKTAFADALARFDR